MCSTLNLFGIKFTVALTGYHWLIIENDRHNDRQRRQKENRAILQILLVEALSICINFNNQLAGGCTWTCARELFHIFGRIE